ncbi:LOW QUALITY PROTEIN: solute carrier family 35 member F6-like [Penaeus japonicus]|uniref:LOW QUALITY PROTEIN: solute carrier family 35 member F6-like n=1 Tax=Penaeus japonicus TaxID=27405 RepID=UPI001C70CF24|nr:LOW QUALITY PROTEIN: solute carrier family 35 member F6-like [Penaeus japonicus]
MAWSKKQLLLYWSVVMVTTGSINTLSTKWADLQTSENREGNMAKFNHPFFQATGMFVGETLCMLTFFIQRAVVRHRSRNSMELYTEPLQTETFPPLVFYIPAICDMTATSLMYLGLTLTFASSFQMLRGAVIVFTGLLSVAFLGRRLRYYHWMGIFSVLLGLIVVGLSDFLNTDTQGNTDMNAIITGDLLIVMAQIVTATQMVVEEKFLTKYRVPPLLVVGWEGLFGFLTLSILLVPMYYIPGGMFSGNERGVMEDAIDAFVQLGNNGTLLLAFLLNVFSIAFFNFAGVSVTKELSATTRMVLDSVRTLVVWLASIALQWQNFQYLQPVGFLVLVVGMMLYNDVVIFPVLRRKGIVKDTPVDPPAPVSPAAQNRTQSPGQDVVDDTSRIDPF